MRFLNPIGSSRERLSARDNGPADHFSFVIDQGSELEYHLELCLPQPPSLPRSDIPLQQQPHLETQQKQLDIVLRELERVYCAEDLPAWRCDSFLAVAAALAGTEAGEWVDTDEVCVLWEVHRFARKHIHALQSRILLLMLRPFLCVTTRNMRHKGAYLKTRALKILLPCNRSLYTHVGLVVHYFEGRAKIPSERSCSRM